MSRYGLKLNAGPSVVGHGHGQYDSKGTLSTHIQHMTAIRCKTYKESVG